MGPVSDQGRLTRTATAPCSLPSQAAFLEPLRPGPSPSPVSWPPLPDTGQPRSCPGGWKGCSSHSTGTARTELGGGRLFSEPQDACWTDGETGSEVPCLPACLPAWRLAHLPVPGPALSAATMPSRGPCLMLLSQHPAMLNRFWTTGISFCSGLRKFSSQPCPGQREKDRRCWCPPPTCPTRGISALFPGKPCSVPGVRRLTLGAARCPFSGSQATWGV